MAQPIGLNGAIASLSGGTHAADVAAAILDFSRGGLSNPSPNAAGVDLPRGQACNVNFPACTRWGRDNSILVRADITPYNLSCRNRRQSGGLIATRRTSSPLFEPGRK